MLSVIILTICLFFMPESPRFLIVKNKLEKANEILNKIKKKNYGQSIHPVDIEEIKMKAINGSKDSSNSMNEYSKQENTDKKIVKKEYDFMKILFLVVIWFAINMSYYGVSLGIIYLYFLKY